MSPPPAAPGAPHRGPAELRSGGSEASGRWRFAIDRGGTFTDVVARDPAGRRHVVKLLSDDSRHGEDAALHAMRRLAGADLGATVASVRLGTTVATNALLEHAGERVCLAITRGFGDALRIGFQDRPELFELEIVKPPPLHAEVVEIDERILADGTVRLAPDPLCMREQLAAARRAGCRSLAIVLMHGFAHPEHERLVEQAGRAAGFEAISLSSVLAPEIGLVARGETTCVDAYLTPILERHVAALREELGAGVELSFMTSGGGLAPAEAFSGKDAILSGPAGGAVAVAAIARRLGLSQAIGFDMGGTSTDVCRWSEAEGFERVYERSVAGRRLRAPMLDIVTVAAGGGSVLASSGRRFSVGPESAGAAPGPAGYGAGGPATITDANAVLGRIQPEWFPRCFGPEGRSPLDVEASRHALGGLAEGAGLDVDDAALGFLRIANENMAAAMRQVSVARGRDLREHALVCFGGAGAQHACALASLLGIERIVLHPLAGVFSAHGIGLADVARTRVEPLLCPLSEALERAPQRVAALSAEERPWLGRVNELKTRWGLDLRHRGVEHALHVPAPEEDSPEGWRAAFEDQHERLFGFTRPGHPIEASCLRMELVGHRPDPPEPGLPPRAPGQPLGERLVAFEAQPGPGPAGPGPSGSSGGTLACRLSTPVHDRAALAPGQELAGPALIVEEISTILLEPGWTARVEAAGEILIERVRAAPSEAPTLALGLEVATAAEVDPVGPDGVGPDPVGLEVFANRFMSIAEQMGETLRRVSCSTNIKERLDYSCALFTPDGRLVANAPHVPVHLGAMGETVRAILEARGGGSGLRPGQAIASNDPFHGGSHLPDVTVVSPVFVEGKLAYFVANRGHHGDMGGIQPGSMPPDSRTIDEEGLRFHDLTLVEDGRFREDELRRLLAAGPFPVRDVDERLADLRSQVAANAMGQRLLLELCRVEGSDRVQLYMARVIEDAAAATRELLAALPPGERSFEDALDDGSPIAVRIVVEPGHCLFDFTGTAAQQDGNLNAPRAVTTAAVLFVLRCLIGRRIPLNAGCLEPISILVPRGSLLDPLPPAAVAGGNVETSQRVADVLLAALGALAASQGTMNNVTFGDAGFGYYETIGGGAGAGPGFPGASGVHVHLTNTRITDAEVLERRHPVLVREFALRRGSGGAGRFPGGDGLVRALEFLRPLEAAVLSERRSRAPFGLEGGRPGQAGRNTLRRAGGRVELLPGRARFRAECGDVLLVETPGGGGFGAPPELLGPGREAVE